MEEREHSGEILDQNKTEDQPGKLKSLYSMSDVKTLFRSPRPFSSDDYNMLLSLGLVPLPVRSSSWHLSFALTSSTF